jgi:hypothetical protein
MGYKASLESARKVFTLLVIILTNESVRKTSAAQLLGLIKTANATDAPDLGKVVRRALVNMAEQTYANGISLGHVNGIISRVRRDGHI